MSEAAERLVIGRITGCYGIKGWVRIHSYTEPMENFLEFSGFKGLVAHIRGVDDRDLAESFQGLEVSVASNALPELEEGDYYWHQLQGLQVWCHTDNGQVLLGAVDYLIETGANDVLVVKPCEGSIDQRERLIPWLPGTTVRQVDEESGRIEVDWFLED